LIIDELGWFGGLARLQKAARQRRTPYCDCWTGNREDGTLRNLFPRVVFYVVRIAHAMCAKCVRTAGLGSSCGKGGIYFAENISWKLIRMVADGEQTAIGTG
jgi:hypothetical protein